MQRLREAGNLAAWVQNLVSTLSRIMALVAALCLAAMMLLTAADVIGRYFFKTPMPGAWELISYLLVCAGTWGLAYCQVEKGHISVTFLLEAFSPRLQAAILSLACFAGLVVFSVLTGRAVQLAHKYFSEAGHTTDTLHMPIFPFLLVMAAGTGMMALVLLIDVIQTIGKEVRK
jgi:TRAP-type C4-dicarboxylate transport system permease small subunit